MTYWVIKKIDGTYYKDQLTGGLRFVQDLSNASFYVRETGARETVKWIVINEYRYKIRKEQLKVVKAEIKEIEDDNK